MNKPQNSYGGPPQTITTVQDGKPPMSLFWPLGFLAGWIISFIAGVALIASYIGSANCSTEITDSYYAQRVCTGGKKGEYYAGIVFVIIAVVLKLVFWVLLIMRCVQRRRGYVTVTTVVENGRSVHEQQIPLARFDEPTGYPPQVYQDNAPMHQRYA